MLARRVRSERDDIQHAVASLERYGRMIRQDQALMLDSLLTLCRTESRLVEGKREHDPDSGG